MPQTAAQIAEFLDKLDSDDDFRNALFCDPASVFDDYGVTYDPNDLPQAQNIKLPPKGDVAANYNAYKDALFPNNDFSSNDLLIDLS